MSKDDDVPKKLQNDFLHQMYEDFGTIEEDCFYDRLEDGKTSYPSPQDSLVIMLQAPCNHGH